MSEEEKQAHIRKRVAEFQPEFDAFRLSLEENLREQRRSFETWMDAFEYDVFERVDRIYQRIEHIEEQQRNLEREIERIERERDTTLDN